MSKRGNSRKKDDGMVTVELVTVCDGAIGRDEAYRALRAKYMHEPAVEVPKAFTTPY